MVSFYLLFYAIFDYLMALYPPLFSTEASGTFTGSCFTSFYFLFTYSGFISLTDYFLFSDILFSMFLLSSFLLLYFLLSYFLLSSFFISGFFTYSFLGSYFLTYSFLLYFFLLSDILLSSFLLCDILFYYFSLTSFGGIISTTSFVFYFSMGFVSVLIFES